MGKSYENCTMSSKKRQKKKLLMIANEKDEYSEQVNIKMNPTVMQREKESKHPKEISSNRLLKAQQFKAEDVLKNVIEATKEEENLFVGLINKASLTRSKSVFVNGMVTNNKKLLINFLKDCIVA